MKSKLIYIFLLTLVITGIYLSTNPQKNESIEFTAGPIGGGWYSMASGMAKIVMEVYPELNIRVVPGGGVTNPSKIQIGKSQLGLGLDVFTSQAFNGNGVYKERGTHEKLMMIGMSFSDTYFHYIKSVDSDVGFPEILTTANNQNIGVTKAGSTDEQTFRWILDLYKTNYEKLRKEHDYKINLANYSELAGQFKDRQIDYVFMNLGLPGAAVIDMTIGREGNVLSLPKNMLTEMKNKYGFQVGSIPAGTYSGQTDDAMTLKYATVLLVSSDVDEDKVYKITKALCADEEKLRDIHASMVGFSCKTATLHAPVPIHPGAKRYYNEKGYLNPE